FMFAFASAVLIWVALRLPETLTDENGIFRLDMPQIVPAFGQAHGHLAYDADLNDGGFETVFMRPVMANAGDTTLSVDFVLQPA
ncbi:hypothetical protein N9H93_01550, partial [Rhizobiaceae bacterium]|nr:hypothetical protein [Rhizobiaceae bacterium]